MIQNFKCCRYKNETNKKTIQYLREPFNKKRKKETSQIDCV